MKPIFALLLLCCTGVAQNQQIKITHQNPELAEVITNPTHPPNTLSSVVACIVPIPLNSVPVTWSAGGWIRGSGYHPHELTESIVRPKPVVEITITHTDTSTGCTHNVVEWPVYAGVYAIIACSTGTVNFCDAQNYDIKNGPYTQASVHTGYSFWPDPAHSNLQMGLTGYEQFILQDVGAKYYQHTGLTFQVMRASLPWGGWNDDQSQHFTTLMSDPHPTGDHWDVVPPLNIQNQTILLGLLTTEPDIFGGYCKVTKYIAPVYWDVDCE
jgi:hypothetical protein